MEQFMIANGCALRVSDTPRQTKFKPDQTPPTEDKGVIVLLHGYLESLDVWDDFTKLLTPQARVVAIDLPGHGVSEVKGEVHTMAFLADTLRAVLDRLGVERCTVVGHSMGGYVALEFLNRHPERVSALVLFHSTPNPDTEEKKNDRQREIAVIDSGRKELLTHSAEKGFAADNRKRFADEIEGLALQISLTEDEGIKALLRGMCAREDRNRTLSESKVPQLFILGAKDEYITPPVAERMTARHPQAQVCMLSESGHMGFIEQPAEAAAALLGFIPTVGVIAPAAE